MGKSGNSVLISFWNLWLVNLLWEYLFLVLTKKHFLLTFGDYRKCILADTQCRRTKKCIYTEQLFLTKNDLVALHSLLMDYVRHGKIQGQ